MRTVIALVLGLLLGVGVNALAGSVVAKERGISIKSVADAVELFSVTWPSSGKYPTDKDEVTFRWRGDAFAKCGPSGCVSLIDKLIDEVNCYGGSLIYTPTSSLPLGEGN